MSFSKAKESISKRSSTLDPQGIKKSKPKKKSIAEVRAKREAIKEKIRIDEENLKKANGGGAMNIDEINVELNINRSTLQALNEEGDTSMSEEAGNDASADSTSDVIITHSQSNNESDIKQENQKADIAMTSIETYDDEDLADLVKPDDILDQDTTTDEKLIGWRSGGRERDMIVVDGMSFRTWETRTTVRRIWGDSLKRADLAILEGFLKAQTRYNEWKKGQRDSKDRSSTPNSTLQAPLVTFSSSPQSITTSSAATTSLTVPTSFSRSAQSVSAAQSVTAQAGATEQSVSEATQQPVPGATQQSVSEPTQLPTSGATPQLTTEITFQSEKKQVTDQEKEIEARRAFMAVMFDGMSVEEKSTKSQQIKVAMLWAQKKIEIFTN
ncbi:MAG: hypothetical protein Q9195_001661 [Heterodermia aff. obscurata]